ncbi:MAG: NAD-dependent protein deacylase [Candidatus Thorarchaeota archaeon]|nr:MAG: NAD-dependent protein deacylase [Candidatus Thorarchaeota archaeon]RLI58326.1 MAG: NAD-dependent protein deacylase [Candidatus Thorarchaeota archaeon]
MMTRAAQIIRDSEHLIALTGAGISKESNVPTFRGEDGLWKEYDAMELATPQAFRSNPQLVWEWYSWRQGLIAKCSPNPAHEVLARWEREGLLKVVITQNVDGLHRRAGSTQVLEVHGDLWALKCTSCSYRGRLSEPAVGVPVCPVCGANLRPDVVWFGEPLPSDVLSRVHDEIAIADACLVVGTSALVQPAASFPLVVKQHGGLLIEVNVESTPLTPPADVHLSGKAGEVLPSLDMALGSSV